MPIEIDPNTTHILLGRHLQQKTKPDLKGSDWDAHVGLDLDIAGPAAERIRKEYLDSLEIMKAVSSQLVRAAESAQLLAPHAFGFFRQERLNPSDYKNKNGTWLFCDQLENGDAIECCQAAPDLMLAEGAKVMTAAQDQARLLKPGEVSLLITHGPIIDAAYAAATGRWPIATSIGKGQIIHLQFDNQYRIVGADLLPPV